MQFEKEISGQLEDINIFETKHNLNLPIIYKDFLITQNGGNLCDLYTYVNKDSEYVVNGFFGIKNRENHLDLDIQYANLKTKLPKGYFPIADDSGGNYYLIKLKIKKAPIYFWNHNLQASGTKAIGLERIADSFKNFINGIELDTTEIKVTVIETEDSIIIS